LNRNFGKGSIVCERERGRSEVQVIRGEGESDSGGWDNEGANYEGSVPGAVLQSSRKVRQFKMPYSILISQQKNVKKEKRNFRKRNSGPK